MCVRPDKWNHFSVEIGFSPFALIFRSWPVLSCPSVLDLFLTFPLLHSSCMLLNFFRSVWQPSKLKRRNRRWSLLQFRSTSVWLSTYRLHFSYFSDAYSTPWPSISHVFVSSFFGIFLFKNCHTRTPSPLNLSSNKQILFTVSNIAQCCLIKTAMVIVWTLTEYLAMLFSAQFHLEHWNFGMFFFAPFWFSNSFVINLSTRVLIY